MKLFATRNCFALLLATFVVVSCSSESEKKPETDSGGVSLHTELGGDAEGYDRACGPREFVFPQDHGAHPSFRNEWWYITGNLQSTNAMQFGFHATFFRVGNRLAESMTDEAVSSDWVADEFYMAHFAITQQAADQVSAHERFGRAAAGLAGAVVNKSNNSDALVKVWLDDWKLIAREINGQLVWSLQIKDGEDALDLTLIADKPIVLQGRDGYSQKSADPCNSSYYYSMPRMQASGQVVANDQSHAVNGTAWLDREWSSSALADDQVGWDWFALQMDDGRDIMFYQLRKDNGAVDPYSHAVEIDKEGLKTEIPSAHFKLNIDRWWQSESGSRYPVSGTITRADTGEIIVYRPLIDDQELDLTVRYWEGAIVLTDESGQSIGRGYLELTGY